MVSQSANTPKAGSSAKNKKMLIAGAVVALAYIGYTYYKSKKSSPTTSTSTTAPTSPTSLGASAIDPQTGVPYASEGYGGNLGSDVMSSGYPGQGLVSPYGSYYNQDNLTSGQASAVTNAINTALQSGSSSVTSPTSTTPTGAVTTTGTASGSGVSYSPPATYSPPPVTSTAPTYSPPVTSSSPAPTSSPVSSTPVITQGPFTGDTFAQAVTAQNNPKLASAQGAPSIPASSTPAPTNAQRTAFFQGVQSGAIPSTGFTPQQIAFFNAVSKAQGG